MYNVTNVTLPCIKAVRIISAPIINNAKIVHFKVTYQLPVIVQGGTIIEIERITPMDGIIPNGNVTDGYII